MFEISPSEVFVNVVIFGKCSETFVWPSDNFGRLWKSSESSRQNCRYHNTRLRVEIQLVFSFVSNLLPALNP